MDRLQLTMVTFQSLATSKKERWEAWSRPPPRTQGRGLSCEVSAQQIPGEGPGQAALPGRTWGSPSLGTSCPQAGPAPIPRWVLSQHRGLPRFSGRADPALVGVQPPPGDPARAEFSALGYGGASGKASAGQNLCRGVCQEPPLGRFREHYPEPGYLVPVLCVPTPDYGASDGSLSPSLSLDFLSHNTGTTHNKVPAQPAG